MLDARRANLDSTFTARHKSLATEIANVEDVYKLKSDDLDKKRAALVVELSKHRSALESVLSAAKVEGK